MKRTINAVIEIARGMLTILKHFFRPPITQEYPEVKPELNERYRGRLALLTKPDGTDMCIGCKMCVKVCPCCDLIKVEKGKEFTIDIGRCIFCGNCTEVCPTGAIIMTQEFELGDYSRESLVLDKKALTLSPEESEKWKSMK